MIAAIVRFRALLAGLVIVAHAPSYAQSLEELTRQVFAAESSFARSMAARDTAAFVSFLAPDAIFFGPRGALRGRAAVWEGWRPFFLKEAPPFSWKPEQVEVLDSGGLALSSGPVIDSTDRQIASFNSIWRREPDGTWRVVFDKGCPVCEAPPPSKQE